jgi:hypothetical protein
LIVTKVLTGNACPLKVRDEIVSIDGKTPDELINSIGSAYPGFSDKYRRATALAELRNNENYLPAKFKVKRNGDIIDAEIKRSNKGNFLTSTKPNAVQKFSGDILYADLTLLTEKYLKDSLNIFENCHKIIFDLRGKSDASEQLLAFFANRDIAMSFDIPVYIRPDCSELLWKSSPSTISSQKKKWDRELIFLVDERTKGNSSLIAQAARSGGLGRTVGTPFATSSLDPTIFTMSGAYIFTMTAILPQFNSEKMPNAEHKIFEPDVIVDTDINNPDEDAPIKKALELFKERR